MRLEDMEHQKEQYVREHIDACFEEAEIADSYAIQSVLLTEADFYMRELEHRRDDRISTRDLRLEIAVIVLIGAEILISIVGLLIQRANFKDEQLAYEKLQTSSEATAANLVTAANILKTMSEGVQKELDLYYEPSVFVTYNPQNGRDILEVHNYARTSVTVFGIKARNEVCTLGVPISVSSGSFRVLESGFVTNRVVRRVLTAGGSDPLTIYFKAENGKEFQHEILVNRLPIADGLGVTVEWQKTDPISWKTKLAEASVGTCPE